MSLPHLHPFAHDQGDRRAVGAVRRRGAAPSVRVRCTHRLHRHDHRPAIGQGRSRLARASVPPADMGSPHSREISGTAEPEQEGQHQPGSCSGTVETGLCGPDQALQDTCRISYSSPLCQAETPISCLVSVSSVTSGNYTRNSDIIPYRAGTISGGSSHSRWRVG